MWKVVGMDGAFTSSFLTTIQEANGHYERQVLKVTNLPGSITLSLSSLHPNQSIHAFVRGKHRLNHSSYVAVCDLQRLHTHWVNLRCLKVINPWGCLDGFALCSTCANILLLTTWVLLSEWLGCIGDKSIYFCMESISLTLQNYPDN